MSRNRVCFVLTEGQRDALLTLAIFPAAWPSFDRRTWHSLASKALIRFNSPPHLTDAGRVASDFLRTLATIDDTHTATTAARSGAD